MKNTHRHIFDRCFPIVAATLMIATIVVSSCQKIVNIDLNSASPKIVIEGVITDSAGPFHIRITKSGSYFNQPVLPPVTGSLVVITDELGITDTLKEMTPGMYGTSKINGVPGHNYSLKVIAENNEYDATTSMKSRVDIDSLTVEKLQGPMGKLRRRVVCHFKDAKDEKNYYRVKFFSNGKTT